MSWSKFELIKDQQFSNCLKNFTIYIGNNITKYVYILILFLVRNYAFAKFFNRKLKKKKIIIIFNNIKALDIRATKWPESAGGRQ